MSVAVTATDRTVQVNEIMYIDMYFHFNILHFIAE